MITNYFDVLATVGNNPSTQTVFVPHKFAGMEDIADKIRDGAMQASKVPSLRLAR